MASSIYFFNQEIDFKLPQKTKIKNWIAATANQYKFNVLHINFIFCDDAFLLKLNLVHLKHDTYTDIITFDNRITTKKNFDLEAEIYVSVERVKENAKKFNTPFDKELKRVLIHGVLHLIGFKDKAKKDKINMTIAEDNALQLFDSMNA